MYLSYDSESISFSLCDFLDLVSEYSSLPILVGFGICRLRIGIRARLDDVDVMVVCETRDWGRSGGCFYSTKSVGVIEAADFPSHPF